MVVYTNNSVINYFVKYICKCDIKKLLPMKSWPLAIKCFIERLEETQLGSPGISSILVILPIWFEMPYL